ncbi:MAG TPA: ABC transporter permease [Anaerolineales bacterium]|nr:ABC transporter permease [Anaerolineales bacterium]
MNQIWQVMTFEYARHVFRKRFLFALLSLPLFILVMAFVIFLLVRSEFNLKPIGYVDHSGLLTGPDTTADNTSWVNLLHFESEEMAQDALQSEQIQAYYVLSSDYLDTRQTKLVALEEPSGVATSQFAQFVRANLLAQFPAEVVQRVTQGNQLVVQSIDGSRQFVQGDWLGFVLPFMVGFIFLVAVFATSGYLLQAVVEEKENRTMELLVTTITPNKLMAGKIVGIIAVGWTQLIVWFGMVLLLALVGSLFIDLPEWISFPMSYLAFALVLFVPAFIMLAALMVAVGATLTDAQEAQQVTSLFTLPLFIPFWFALTLINHPNGPVAVGLSFFPFTAPITLAIRAGFAPIPPWQIVLSLSLLVICAVAAVWFAGRAFRLGMLRYGQRVAWREFLGFNAKGELER